jgi:hypothetical protein
VRVQDEFERGLDRRQSARVHGAKQSQPPKRVFSLDLSDPAKLALRRESADKLDWLLPLTGLSHAGAPTLLAASAGYVALALSAVCGAKGDRFLAGTLTGALTSTLGAADPAGEARPAHGVFYGSVTALLRDSPADVKGAGGGGLRLSAAGGGAAGANVLRVLTAAGRYE